MAILEFSDVRMAVDLFSKQHTVKNPFGIGVNIEGGGVVGGWLLHHQARGLSDNNHTVAVVPFETAAK